MSDNQEHPLYTDNQDRINFMQSDFERYLKTEVDYSKHIPFDLITFWIHDHGYLDNLENRVCLGKIWLNYYTENVLPKKIKQTMDNFRKVYQNL